jgi:hypothetical protein
MWMSNGPSGGSLQLGVHGNGFPFVLVSWTRSSGWPASPTTSPIRAANSSVVLRCRDSRDGARSGTRRVFGGFLSDSSG